MKLKLERGKTLPIPELEYSSFRYLVSLEWNDNDTIMKQYNELSDLLDKLEELEIQRKHPEYITQADKLASLKNFLTKLSAHPKLWPEVRIEWQKYLDEKRSIHNQ